MSRRTNSSTKPIQRILEMLDNVRPNTSGWTALCPAHGDERSSLSVTDGEDGRVLLHCFAGCDVNDIVAALGLELSDLFPRKRTKISRKGVKRHGPYA